MSNYIPMNDIRGPIEKALRDAGLETDHHVSREPNGDMCMKVTGSLAGDVLADLRIGLTGAGYSVTVTSPALDSDDLDVILETFEIGGEDFEGLDDAVETIGSADWIGASRNLRRAAGENLLASDMQALAEIAEGDQGPGPRGFVQFSRAWYAEGDNQSAMDEQGVIDEIVVGPLGEEGHYPAEDIFIEWRKSASQSDEPPVMNLRIPGDNLGALRRHPDLFRKLAPYEGLHPTPSQVREELDNLGFADVTETAKPDHLGKSPEGDDDEPMGGPR